MVTLDHLRHILRREILRTMPRAIDLRLPDEPHMLLPVTPDDVINELIVRGVDEVEIVRIDADYLVHDDFLYVLAVELR